MNGLNTVLFIFNLLSSIVAIFIISTITGLSSDFKGRNLLLTIDYLVMALLLLSVISFVFRKKKFFEKTQLFCFIVLLVGALYLVGNFILASILN